jgi:hypothetical protein
LSIVVLNINSSHIALRFLFDLPARGRCPVIQTARTHRGTDTHWWAEHPPEIPACVIHAPGSHLAYLTAKAGSAKDGLPIVEEEDVFYQPFWALERTFGERPFTPRRDFSDVFLSATEALGNQKQKGSWQLRPK